MSDATRVGNGADTTHAYCRSRPHDDDHGHRRPRGDTHRGRQAPSDVDQGGRRGHRDNAHLRREGPAWSGASSGPQTSDYAYDAKDRVSSVTDALGRATQYDHDAGGRVSAVTQPGGGVFGFAHDPMDRLTEVTLPGGAKHRLTYTPAGRVKSYRPAGSGATGYVNARDADGALTSTTLPGGARSPTGTTGAVASIR